MKNIMDKEPDQKILRYIFLVLVTGFVFFCGLSVIKMTKTRKRHFERVRKMQQNGKFSEEKRDMRVADVHYQFWMHL